MDLLRSLWFILPAYFANSSAVLRGKAFGRTLMDFGKTLGGKPILGSHKTREGFFGAVLTAYAIAFILRSFARRPTPLEGFLMGLGAMTGDAFGSFIKRRLNIQPGKPLPVLDQELFLIFSLLFVRPIRAIPLSRVIFLLIITPILHLAFNLLAYRLGLKDVRRRALSFFLSGPSIRCERPWRDCLETRGVHEGLLEG